MATRRFDVNVEATGAAAILGAGGQYLAQVYEAETGRKSDIYAYGGSEHEARAKAVTKIRERYGAVALIVS